MAIDIDGILKDLRSVRKQIKEEEEHELSLLPTIKFKDIKEDLLKALNDIDLNIEDKNLHPGEPLELLEGFLNPLIPGEIHDYFRVTKTTLPMIMLLGKRTHRIYFFSLMRLLPDLDF